MPKKKEGKLPDKPPLMTCEECSADYKDWEVSADDWALMPMKYLGKALCEPCYLRILKKGGHDTTQIKITHKSGKRKVKYPALKDGACNYAQPSSEA